MSEQEEKVLKLCRYWYQTASDISRQTLWYEIGVMLENETAAQQSVQRTCFYCDENKEPAKEAICQDCVDLLSDASR